MMTLLPHVSPPRQPKTDEFQMAKKSGICHQHTSHHSKAHFQLCRARLQRMSRPPRKFLPS